MSALLKPSPAPSERPARVHVSFPMTLSGRLRMLAAERHEHAEAMIAALIDYVLSHDLADGMLDALHGVPGPGHGRLVAGGAVLTHNQAAVLLLIGENRDADGVCRLSTDRLSILLGGAPSIVGNALAVLARRGLIERDPSPVPGRLRPCRLTASGYAAWHDLARGE